ncbi:unnamed protein product [Boreogadus saida]
MASLDVQPRLMEARPDPDTPAQMRAAVARYLAANALKDKALSTAYPSPIQPNNKSTPSPTQHSSNSCNPTPNPTQPRTSSINSSCNPTPNPTQPRTSRPKEEWLEHLIHHFNLSKKKQKKEAQQEGSLGELLKQMCKMNIEKDMEATRQLKERAEEDLDLMAMMSLMTHQQETFPQVTPLPEWIRQGNLPTTYTTYVVAAMEQPSTKQNYPYRGGGSRSGRDKAMRLFPCMHCNQMGHWIRDCPKYHSDTAQSRFPSQPSTKQNYPYRGGGSRRGRDKAMRLFPCMHCNQMGHWIRDCPKYHSDTAQYRFPSQQQQQQNTGFKTLPAAGNAMLALQQ